ncbi:hypothetical protein Aperf_G00000057098 [Anoplocephala perfoliata]
MTEESDSDSEDFAFWLKICTALTVIFYTFCGISLFLLRQIVGNALNEVLRKIPPRPKMENVVPFSNPVAITKVVHLENENRLDITLSLSRSVHMYVLRNVPLWNFHNAMISSTEKFQRFIVETASETVPVTTPSISVNTNETQISFHLYRNSYDLVLVFFDDRGDLNDESEQESVVFSFHMIHVKQYKEERRPTQVLYSYCKTNRDRLICLRKVFASDAGNTSANRPECSPLQVCVWPTSPCENQNYPYSMNEESASDVNQSPCDSHMPSQTSFVNSPEESRYQYLPNTGEASEEHQPSAVKPGSQPQGSPGYSNGYSPDPSREIFPQQPKQRSITFTWRFEGEDIGSQRPTATSSHRQAQNQRPWIPDQTYQRRPAISPPPRSSNTPMKAPSWRNDRTQSQRPPGMRPIPRPRQTRPNPMGHSWESYTSNQQGQMIQQPVANLPCP